MTWPWLPQFALLAGGCAAGALGITVALWRAARLVRDLLRAKVTSVLRPVVLEVATAEAPDPRLMAQLAGLDRRRWSALEPEVLRLMAKIRGGSRDALADLLVRRGATERARRRLGSHWASRRARAARTLGLLRTVEAAPALRKMLADRSDLVRRVAAEALGHIGDQASVAYLLDAPSSRRPVPAPVAAGAVLRIGPAAVGPVTEALSSPDPVVVELAADLAGRLGALRAVPALRNLVASGPGPVGVAAAGSLGRMGAPSATSELLAALGKGRRDLCLAALRALGQIGDQSVAPAVGPLVARQDTRVAVVAAETLLQLGEAGKVALAEAAAGSSLVARRVEAVQAASPAARAGAGSPRALGVVGLGHALLLPAGEGEPEALAGRGAAERRRTTQKALGP